MFDRKKAAEFFVVAWVKDWSIGTYLDVIGAKTEPIENIVALYPWMPKDQIYYKSHKKIKTIAARYMRAINDLMWDAKDNKARLLLAQKICNWKSDAYVKTLSDKEREYQMAEAKKQYMVTAISNSLEIEKMRRSSGNHWNVCK